MYTIHTHKTHEVLILYELLFIICNALVTNSYSIMIKVKCRRTTEVIVLFKKLRIIIEANYYFPNINV